MLDKFINYFSNKSHTDIVYNFSFLEFEENEDDKDLFYLEKIRAENFFESEGWIVIDNTKWKDALNEIKLLWMFWNEKFAYFTDLLFNWKTKTKSIIDCLNINSRIKENNYIELSLNLRDYVSDSKIFLKRVFKNIENDSHDSEFYYYENDKLITQDSNDEIVKRKFRSIKLYNRVLLLSQAFYYHTNQKNKYQNELDKLEKDKKDYEIKEYKKLKKELIWNYNIEYNNLIPLEKMLFQYDKEKLYETMDYINKNPRTFAKDESVEYVETILDFLFNIWFTNIPQIEANKMFEIVDKDIWKYGLEYQILDINRYFHFLRGKSQNKPFENIIYFFNTLLTWDKEKPIDIKNIELYKKNWVKTSYNTKEFWDYVKQTLLDENWNIRLEILENNFLSDEERLEKVKKLTNEIYKSMWMKR